MEPEILFTKMQNSNRMVPLFGVPGLLLLLPGAFAPTTSFGRFPGGETGAMCVGWILLLCANHFLVSAWRMRSRLNEMEAEHLAQGRNWTLPKSSLLRPLSSLFFILALVLIILRGVEDPSGEAADRINDYRERLIPLLEKNDSLCRAWQQAVTAPGGQVVEKLAPVILEYRKLVEEAGEIECGSEEIEALHRHIRDFLELRCEFMTGADPAKLQGSNRSMQNFFEEREAYFQRHSLEDAWK